jgi:membrane protein
MSEVEIRSDEARSWHDPYRAALKARLRPLRPLRPAWAILHDSFDGLIRHDGLMVASGISYSLIFALFPFVIFLVALGASFGGADLSDYISREALAVLPGHVIRTLEPELNRIFATAGRASPLTFGLLVTLISITSAVEAIRDGLNRAYGCTEHRHMVRRYASSLFFVFIGMAFILAVAGWASPCRSAWSSSTAIFPSGAIEVRMLEFGRQVLLAVITFAMLLAFHMLLPARRERRRLRKVVAGVLLTLVGWWIAGKLFGFYITRIANYSTTYAGLAGS